ncbi:MAG TPA: ABC transporter permease [Ktedonobacterales bacterium]
MSVDEQPERAVRDASGDGKHEDTLTANTTTAAQSPLEARLSAPTQAELDRRAAGGEAVTEGQSLSPTQAALRRLGRDRRAMFFTAATLLIIVFAYVGPLIYTRVGPVIHNGGVTGTDDLTPMQYHNYVQIDISRQDAYPNFGIVHPLGTDAVGRDILARLMAGINISIEVALLVEVFDVGLGVLIGALAGYYGGWIATLLDRFTDIMFAFPGLLFAILAAGTLGPLVQSEIGLSGRLILVSAALGITAWPFMARLVRGQTLQLREQQFIEAARTVGTSDVQIILRHVVPNLFNLVVVAAVLDMVGTIGGEAVLSLLGLGVQPPGSSLGLMINDAVPQVLTNVWEAVWPTLALTVLMLAFSFVGDGVQDAFNPRTVD